MDAPGPTEPPATPTALPQVLQRSRELGFLGPGPVDDHIVHAERLVAVIEDLQVPEAVTAIDLGSGGGVPGLIAATATPTWSWVLLDAMERRTAFLSWAVEALGLTQTRVLRERAELTGRSPLRGRADVVVARSFGPPAVTAECAAPLLRSGGHLLVSEPPEATSGRWSDGGLDRLGLDPDPVQRGSWIVFRQVVPAPEAFPRKVGQPAKRPLW